MSESEFIDPQQEVTVESIIAEKEPGKASPEAALALAGELQAMSDAELLRLLGEAQREDPAANMVVIAKAKEILGKRGKGEAATKELEAARSEDWKSLLGDKIGGKAADAIIDNVNEAKLTEYGQKALKSALDKVPDLVEKLGLDGGGTAAVQKLAAALAEDGVKIAEEWLKSPDGQELFIEISNWVDENPGWILAAAIIAAAGGAAYAVASDMEIPELEQDFKLGKHVTGTAGVQLGSLQNIALEAAKLNLDYINGKFTASAGAEYEKGKDGEDDKLSAQAQMRYGSKESFVLTKGKIDPDGNLIIGLNAALKKGAFTGKMGVESNEKDDTKTATIDAKIGDKDAFVGAKGKVVEKDDHIIIETSADFKKGLLSGQLAHTQNSGTGAEKTSAEMKYGDKDTYGRLYGSQGKQDGASSTTWGAEGAYKVDDNHALTAGYENKDGEHTSKFGHTYTDENYEIGQTTSYSSEEGYSQGLDAKYKQDKYDLGLSLNDKGMDGSIDAFQADFGFKHDAWKTTLGIGKTLDSGTTGKASLDYKKDGWTGYAGIENDFSTSDIDKLSLGLGFRDPDKFKAFSIDFSRQTKNASTDTELKGMFESQLGKYMLRGTGSATLMQGRNEGGGFTGENDHKFSAGLHAGRFIDDAQKWAVIAGARYQYDSRMGGDMGGSQHSFIPEVGIQYKKIPVMIGYDTQNKAVTVGISIPFGR